MRVVGVLEVEADEHGAASGLQGLLDLQLDADGLDLATASNFCRKLLGRELRVGGGVGPALGGLVPGGEVNATGVCQAAARGIPFWRTFLDERGEQLAAGCIS